MTDSNVPPSESPPLTTLQPPKTSVSPPSRQAPLPEHPPIEAEMGAQLVGELRAELSKAVLGQSQAVDQVLCAFLAGGHVLLEGVPGVGKTLMVLALSRAIKGTFGRVQFTPDLMPSDVTGHVLYEAATGKFRIRRGPVFVNFLLADEINRAPAKTQAALLELMQEQQVTIEGRPYPLPEPFMTLATQNPAEHEGTYPLPEAQLDRFLIHVRLGYPEAADENSIVRSVTQQGLGQGLNVDGVSAVLDLAQVVALRKTVAKTLVDDSVLDYAVRLVRATRQHRALAFGAGPRAAIALVRVARAAAVMQGRAYVTPDDVRELAPAVLRHRVSVSPELEVEGLHADRALESALEGVEAPRS